jgi:methyltransferase-like protein/ubiquinone/menaquinone biosynthesis C-methylase UbiE
MTDIAASYDEVPYDSKPLFSTHPDCLGTAGRLRGLSAAPASNCRVLELGCATGGNLIPMAYALPGSRFVGIDLSPAQIAAGESLCRKVGLTNIALHAASIADLDASWGQFDYIICHGVFSWVPPAIRDKILWICRHLLAPAGVAYISYNTYPGWHMKNIVRDLMRYQAARFDDPQTKIQQARSILTFMARASAGLDNPISRLLSGQAESLADDADYYLYHEHLEDSNQPFYFHEFVAQARGAGLEYLGEAWHHTQLDNLPADVQETLQAISRDLIDLEQYVDIINSRTFRRTLLCHAEVPIEQTPDPSVLDTMHLSALARPAASQPDVCSDAPEKFLMDDGTSATTNIPLCKAALLELFQHWPATLPFTELCAAAAARVGPGAPPPAAARQLLAAFLIRGYVAQVTAVHSEPFSFTRRVSDRPRASRLARIVSAERPNVPNLRHRLIVLSPLDRHIVPWADGSRSVAEIAAAAGAAAHDSPAAELRNQPAEVWTQWTTEALTRLASSALLEA